MYTYNTSTPLINFAGEAGWNPIEAWLLGASPVISGSTGIDNLAHTVTAFQDAHKPKFCADKNGKVVDCNSPDRVEGGATGGNNNPIYGQNPSKDNPYGDQIPGGQGGMDNPYGDQIPGGSGTPQNTGQGILQGTIDDWFKRIVLALAAIVIIAIAIASLR